MPARGKSTHLIASTASDDSSFLYFRALGKQFKLSFSSIRGLGQYFLLINFTSEASDNTFR